MKAFTLLIALCISFSTATAQTGWNKQSIPTTQYLPKIFFINKDTGWVGGPEGLYWTTNGGDQWVLLTTKTVVNPIFVDGKNGWGITGSKTVGKTSDGGKTWEDKNTGIVGGLGIHSIDIFGMDTIHAMLTKNFVASTDGGNTWNHKILGLSATRMHFPNSKIGFVCGDNQQWFGDPPPPFGSEGAAFEYTTDGGRSWHARFPFIAGTDSTQWIVENFWCIAATKQNIFVGADTSIYRSSNNGLSWKQVLRQVSIGDLFFLSSERGYAVGFLGTVYFTQDGGENWTLQATPVTNSLIGVHFVDTLHGWACGDLGTIIHTSDGGKLWVRQHLPKPLTTSVTPEPFARKTSISYELPSAAKLKIHIYDILGKELEVLESPGVQEAGTHTIEFDGSRYPEGTFHYQIETDGFYGRGKMTKVVY